MGSARATSFPGREQSEGHMFWICGVACVVFRSILT